MKNIFNKIKQLNQKQLTGIFVVTMILLIFLDMDEYIYPFLNQFGIPLPSTIFSFIWLPVYLLLVYWILEPKKKKVFLIAILIATVYLGYFILHHIMCKDLVEVLYLPESYFYSVKDEFIYIVIMVLPLLYIYAVYRLQLSMNTVEKIIIILSMMISVPIVVTNLFTCSPSTYTGWTKANFISWFFGIYDTYYPREIATKFFFSEGNTTGIVLFMTFPIMLNILYKSKTNWKMIIAVVIQALAMYCLATRVATYGVLLLLAVYLVIWIFCIILKKATFHKKFIIVYLFIFLAFGAAFPYTPAYVNQQLNIENNGLIIDDEYIRQDVKNSIKDPGLVYMSEEYINFWSWIFVDNVHLLSLPKQYYTKYYFYRFDPKFWVDLIFEYDFYQRASGRDFELIFSNYKWAKLTPVQKLFGFSYSIFMNGGITLEQDFAMQKYTHGYIGTVLLCFPWIAVLLVIVFYALKRFKDVIGTDILVLGVAFVGGLCCGYASGHTLDQLFSSMVLALLAGKLLSMVIQPKKDIKENEND